MGKKNVRFGVLDMILLMNILFYSICGFLYEIGSYIFIMEEVGFWGFFFLGGVIGDWWCWGRVNLFCLLVGCL